MKSFNYALDNDYHTKMDGPMEDITYNMDLVNELKAFLKQYKIDNPDEEIKLMKADYLAERSIQDNIVLESSQNTFVVIISYIMMFLYVSIAIGFFPNMIHMKFGLGAVGILVVIFSLFSGMGLTFYWN